MEYLGVPFLGVESRRCVKSAAEAEVLLLCVVHLCCGDIKVDFGRRQNEGIVLESATLAAAVSESIRPRVHPDDRGE